MLQVDWKVEENRPVKPKLLGTKVYKDYAVKDIIDYIDWNPFFQVHFFITLQCYHMVPLQSATVCGFVSACLKHL